MPDFSVPNNRFVEVDKDGNNDSNLCWLASACAALWLSDWANNKIYRNNGNNYQAFDNPTAVYNYARQAFPNNGGLSWRGFTWWLANSYPQRTLNNYNLGGFYYLSAKEALSYIYCVTPENMIRLLSATYGAQSSFSSYVGLPAGTLGCIFPSSSTTPTSRSEISGNHEVPIWGYRTELSSSSNTDPASITAFQISDPDYNSQTRFWVPVEYDAESHWYKEKYETASAGSQSSVPSSWPTNCFFTTLSIIMPRPNTIRHIKGLTPYLTE